MAVCVILSDPSCIDGSDRFTAVSLKSLYLINNLEEMIVFLGLKVFNSDNSFIFRCSGITQITFAETLHLKIISFQNFKL